MHAFHKPLVESLNKLSSEGKNAIDPHIYMYRVECDQLGGREQLSLDHCRLAQVLSKEGALSRLTLCSTYTEQAYSREADWA